MSVSAASQGRCVSSWKNINYQAHSRIDKLRAKGMNDSFDKTRIHIKMLGMVCVVVVLALGRWEQNFWGFLAKLNLWASGSQWEAVLKRVDGFPEDDAQGCPLASRRAQRGTSHMYQHTHMHIQVHMHPHNLMHPTHILICMKYEITLVILYFLDKMIANYLPTGNSRPRWLHWWSLSNTPVNTECLDSYRK